MKWTASTNNPQGFSYLMDHNPNTMPRTVVKITDSEAAFNNLESGIWYFHVRERAAGSWSGASHYSINIDTIPPAEFGIDVSPPSKVSVESPILRFFTTDSLSSFDHFEIKAVSLKKDPDISTFFFEASSPSQLSGLKPGSYQIIVRAFDKAGNFRDELETIKMLSAGLFNSEGLNLSLLFIPWGVFLILIFSLLLIVAGVALIVRNNRIKS